MSPSAGLGQRGADPFRPAATCLHELPAVLAGLLDPLPQAGFLLVAAQQRHATNGLLHPEDLVRIGRQPLTEDRLFGDHQVGPVGGKGEHLSGALVPGDDPGEVQVGADVGLAGPVHGLFVGENGAEVEVGPPGQFEGELTILAIGHHGIALLESALPDDLVRGGRDVRVGPDGLLRDFLADEARLLRPGDRRSVAVDGPAARCHDEATVGDNELVGPGGEFG